MKGLFSKIKIVYRMGFSKFYALLTFYLLLCSDNSNHLFKFVYPNCFSAPMIALHTTYAYL